MAVDSDTPAVSSAAPAVARQDLLVVALLHLLVRYWASRRGLGFDGSPLGYFWQFLDPAWLRETPTASLFALHAQPPGFNALIALAGADPARLGWVIFAFGLFIPVGVFALARRWGAGRAAAGVAALTWSLMPASLLYESWLFYTVPVASLLLAVVLSASWFARGGRIAALIAACVALVLLCWTRSAFHLLWAIAVLGWLVRRRGRQAYVVISVALFFTALPYLHNTARFGFFGTSSWMGMSLAKMAVPFEDPQAASRLRDMDPACWLAHIPPFSPIQRYGAEHVRAGAGLEPALSAVAQGNGHINLNHVGYVQVSADYRTCALTAMADDPAHYFTKVREAATLFFSPPSQYWFLTRGEASIRDYTNTLRGLAPRPWLLGLLVLSAFIATAARRRERDDSIALAFGTAVYYFVVTSLLEVGENQRFAMALWPLFLVAFAVSVDRGARGVLRRFRRPVDAEAAVVAEHVVGAKGGVERVAVGQERVRDEA